MASEEISRLWALMEFTPNSCSSKCLEASIYRLGVKMGVRQNKPVSRPHGGPWPSGRTTVRQDFPKFSPRNLSCIRTSSGRDGSIVRTDARPLQVISITGFTRPDHSCQMSGWFILNCDSCLTEIRVRTVDSCSSQCPRASIYRMRCRMSDCCNMYGRRPDSEPEPSGRTTVRQDFLKISLKSFLFKRRVRTVARPLQVISI
jgi:hypothetical protein